MTRSRNGAAAPMDPHRQRRPIHTRSTQRPPSITETTQHPAMVGAHPERNSRAPTPHRAATEQPATPTPTRSRNGNPAAPGTQPATPTPPRPPTQSQHHHGQSTDTEQERSSQPTSSSGHTTPCNGGSAPGTEQPRTHTTPSGNGAATTTANPLTQSRNGAASRADGDTRQRQPANQPTRSGKEPGALGVAEKAAKNSKKYAVFHCFWPKNSRFNKKCILLTIRKIIKISIFRGEICNALQRFTTKIVEI